MNTLEYAGHSNPTAERAGEKAQRKVLESIEAEIGHEEYRDIINTLATGNIDQLTDRQKEIIQRIREEQEKAHH